MEERLQKIIARAGICSRREAEQLIAEGNVTVNGEIITEPGTKADAGTDHIKVKGKLLQPDEKLVYVLLNKPKGVISTVSDPEGRPSVVDLITGLKSRIYPVGRLDFNTEGILLLTNDGELSNRMLTPSFKCPKTYLVKVNGVPTHAELARLQRGITVDGTRYGSCEIEVMRVARNAWLKVTLSEGKNHQVKNMFEAIGHPVSKLRRIAFSFLTTKGVEVGAWRHLTDVEVGRLKRGDFKPLVPISVIPFLRELGVRVTLKDRDALQRYKDGEEDPSIGKGRYTEAARDGRLPGKAPGKWMPRDAENKSWIKPLTLRKGSESDGEDQGEERKVGSRLGRRPSLHKRPEERSSRAVDRGERSPRRSKFGEGDEGRSRGRSEERAPRSTRSDERSSGVRAGRFERSDERPARGAQRDGERPARGFKRDDARSERGRDDDRSSRPRRDDDRPSRPRRDDDRPSRGRDDARTSRGPGRDSDRPARSFNRDDDRPSRPRRDDDRPARGRDDARDSRGPKRDDDRAPRPRRDDARVSRGPGRDDARVSRGPGRDDDRASRGFKRDEDRPSRPRRDDDRPARPREDARDSRSPRRDDDRPARPREDARDSRGPRRDDDRPARPRRDDDRPARPRRDDDRQSRAPREQGGRGGRDDRPRDDRPRREDSTRGQREERGSGRASSEGRGPWMNRTTAPRRDDDSRDQGERPRFPRKTSESNEREPSSRWRVSAEGKGRRPSGRDDRDGDSGERRSSPERKFTSRKPEGAGRDGDRPKRKGFGISAGKPEMGARGKRPMPAKRPKKK